MDIYSFFELLTNVQFFVKLFAVTLFIFYTVFALVVVRQVDLMIQVIGTGVTPIIRVVSVLHLVLVIVLLISGILFL